MQICDRTGDRAHMMFESSDRGCRGDDAVPAVHPIDLRLRREDDRAVGAMRLRIATRAALRLTNEDMRIGLPRQQINSHKAAEKAGKHESAGCDPVDFRRHDRSGGAFGRASSGGDTRMCPFNAHNALDITLHLPIAGKALLEALPTSRDSGDEERAQPERSSSRRGDDPRAVGV